MAEAALIFAKSILGSAVSKAASAASTEISLLMGVQKEMWFIKDELKTMQAFLQAPEVTEKKDKLVKVWAEQVRDLSYDIEDCLDEFMVHVASHSLSKQLLKLKDRHRIAVQIRNLKSRIEEVSNRNRRYKLIKTESSNVSDDMDSNMEDIRNNSASNIDEAELVGFASPKRELIALIDVTAMNGPAKVICVVGMGGLGKTTLARKAYESKEDTLKSFPYNAWITVSQSFSRRAMLQDMISQFFGVNALNEILKELAGKVLEEGLASYLRREIQDKRYFIVFDDLWEIHHWNWISDVALSRSNNRGSRIIVTTRDVGLARHCTLENIYHLELLQIDDAVKLLQRKTKIAHDDMDNDQNLRTLVTKVVKKCGYLPLAILTIGGVLATKKIAEWENFYNKLPSELESNPSLEAVRRVVTLSYNHLPSHLKPCFVYLSIFPEDYEIKRSHVVGRWIAEGFVRAKVGTTIDEVGKEYFDELISRSMIQSSRLGIEGSVKTCRVHDIMRDIIVSISREENFVHLIHSNGINVPEENFRHVAYHDSKCQKEGMDWRHIRSLTFFTEGCCGWTLDLTPSISTPKLRMLRVLDVVGGNFRITQDGINKIVLLCHLKYLKVRAYLSANIYSVPSDIGNMQGLQILDMGNSYITTLPTEITKLRDLRVIRCNRKGYYFLDPEEPVRCLFATLSLPIILIGCSSGDSYRRARAIGDLHMGCSSGWSRTDGDGVRVPRGIGNLKELEILESVDIRRTSSKAVKELGELTRLRKLAIGTYGASKKKCKILCASIEKLSSLRSLSVWASEHQDRGLGWLISSTSPPPHLRSLSLCGYIGEMTDWFMNLTHLVKILFIDCQLMEDKTMEILGKLPKLMRLKFYSGAYLGEKLVFGTRAFLNLRAFEFEIWGDMDHLKEIRFEEDTSPQMESIDIRSSDLESGIIGVKHLPSLKVIALSSSRVARLRMLEEEVNAHSNRPVLRLSKDRNWHDLGDVEGSNVEVEATESIPDDDTK
ncbi:unnamed protein product [Miscanthus lutarioriparius]|uniref:Uncharacterized protein n=1 Tax=Miscanthus lutarioriparius TaxID=422564 RepID=A0A811Q690_9POAL|nr:unnamed protein product [Miscanthus lutarioriparius]